MDILFYIIISTFLTSLVSFAGILILFLKEKILNKILLFLVAFSAGSLVGGVFLHLIPEALEKVGVEKTALLNLFLCLILGFCVFFVLENFIKWHHHHTKHHPEITSFSYLILLSDGIHNFIDGLIIAASFIASFPTGIATTLATIFHEIPQEIGDFGILIYAGFKKTKAFFLNFLSAILAIFGGFLGFLFSEKIGEPIVVFLLSFAAGSFIYIAVSDLVPEIKYRKNFKKSLVHFFVFLSGIAIMFLMKLI